MLYISSLIKLTIQTSIYIFTNIYYLFLNPWIVIDLCFDSCVSNMLLSKIFSKCFVSDALADLKVKSAY